MAAVPGWVAPSHGLPGNLNAEMTSADLNQHLGVHGLTAVYRGAQLVTPGGAQNFLWSAYGNGTDFSQPFTMSGTAVGRVEVPLQPNGNGADVLVSLYADNGSGSPNLAAGAICSTLLPAQYLNQACAPYGLANAGPLATSMQLTYYFTGGITTGNYLAPVAGAGGIGGGNSAVVSGSYISLIGGSDSLGTTNVVYTIQYTGGGAIAKGVSQPNLPVPTQGGAICATSSAIYLLGGADVGTFSTTTNVWSAAWNSSTGLISSWSSQTALPAALVNASAAIWNGQYIYCVGGENASNALVNTVSVAGLSNGQIGAWTSTTPLPAALQQIFVYVIGNWLIAVGGDASTGVASPVTTVYYAAINPATGAVGSWQSGPSLPSAMQYAAPGWSVINTGDAIAVFSGAAAAGFTNSVYVLGWDTHGPGAEWRAAPWSSVPTSSFHPLYVANGDGSFDVTATYFSGNQYYYSKLIPVPVISVPLPASGLTNSATYHVVLRQMSSTSASDYVAFGTLDGTPLPAAAVTNGRWASGAWASIGAGRSMPLSVFDQTATGTVLHTWEDPSTLDQANSGARWTSILAGASQVPFGVFDVTLQPSLALNSNPTFTSGTSPWTATGGTITQSAAQTHGGLPFSGLLTPAGGTQAYAQTEYLPITQTPWGSAQWILGTGWFFSPTGYSTFTLNLNWFDQAKNYLSTTTNTVSLAANTWTQVTTYGQVPATAAYVTVAPTESGTPTSSNLLYVSNCYAVLTPETVGGLTSAAELNYASSGWPPVTVTQLN